MQFRKAKQVPLRCPYGCGRLVLPSRLAGHFLISSVEHSVAEVQSDRTRWAIGVLTGVSE